MPTVDIDFATLAPLITVVTGALLVLVLDLVLPVERSRGWVFVASLGAVAVAAFYAFQQWTASAANPGGTTTFFGAYVNDRFTLLSHLLILLASGLSMLLSLSWREMQEEPELREDSSGYLSLLLLATAGMMVMVAAGNLITLFVGLELLSLALYVLVGFSRRKPVAREGALKYFILGSVAAGVLLYGFALIYGEVGSMAFPAVAAYWQRAQAVSGLMKLGIGMAVVGFAFKLALVPFHTWAPDAYQAAPTPITAFMAVGTKVAAFAALARFLMVVVPPSQPADFMVPLGILAVLSMAVGSLGAMVQGDLKRLLAYSAISHAGYLILALPARSHEAAIAGMFYLTSYALTSFGAFAVLLWVTRGRREGSELEAFAGLYYRKPWLAIALTLFLLSMAGIPPTGGFVGKLLLVLAGVQGHAWLMITGLVLTTGISAYVYLKVIRTMFSRVQATQAQALREAAATGEASASPSTGWTWLTAAALGLVIVACAVGTVQMGVAPQWLLSGAQGLLPVAWLGF